MKYLFSTISSFLLLISCDPYSKIAAVESYWFLVNNSTDTVTVEYCNMTTEIPSNESRWFYYNFRSIKQAYYLPFEYLYLDVKSEKRDVIVKDTQGNIIRRWTWKEGTEQNEFFEETNWKKTTVPKDMKEGSVTFYWEDTSWTRNIF